MNRTLKEATVRRFHYASHDRLRAHRADFLNAYNFAKRLKTLRGMFEFKLEGRTSVPIDEVEPAASIVRRFATGDLIGLDTILYSLEVLYDSYNDPKFRPCPLLRKMVDAGLHGRKTGRGFFDYGVPAAGATAAA